MHIYIIYLIKQLFQEISVQQQGKVEKAALSQYPENVIWFPDNVEFLPRNDQKLKKRITASLSKMSPGFLKMFLIQNLR